MKYLFLALALLCSASYLQSQTKETQAVETKAPKRLSSPTETKNGMEVFGAAMTATGQPVSLSEAIKNIAAVKGKEIKVSGMAAEVCQNKGCWLMLTDGATSARVTFDKYSFFVPTNSSGKQVTLVGRLEEKVLSEEEAKHYAEDKQAGSGEGIKGPQKEYSLVATSIAVPVK